MSALDHQAFALLDSSDRISPMQMRELTRLILSLTGISIRQGKQTMLEGRLRRAARAAGLPGVGAFCDHVLSHEASPAAIEQLINAVTTNKTDFFREPVHFDYLVETVLPDYAQAGLRQFRAWSAACSSGAEPYTMAMLLDDFVSRNRGMDYRILATDLDSEILATAVRGVYPPALVEPVPADLRRRYVLEARNPARQLVRIASDLRRKVAFGQLNLIDKTYPIGEPMHVIFCRNVLIYFDKPTQEEVVARLCDCLVPGGYLFLGHSESIAGFSNDLEQVGSTTFRRKGRA